MSTGGPGEPVPTLPVAPITGQEDVEALLHDLLPRFYWLFDDRAGGALAALVAVLADQYGELRTSVDQMYDDLFIDTCGEALVPYLGDGLGVTGLAPVDGSALSYRAWVGRIVGFRRRKGTLATLGRSMAAATGWGVFVQNGYEQVGHTQSVRHPSAGGGLVDIAGLGAGADPTAPWSAPPRTVSVAGRPLIPGRAMDLDPAMPDGSPSPGTVDIAVWRLQSFYVAERTPGAVTSAGAPPRRAFTFHPFGLDSALFTTPGTTDDATQPPSPPEIPMPLTPGALRAALDGSSTGSGVPAVTVRLATGAGAVAPVPANRMRSGDLSLWAAPVADDVDVVVDPGLGRMLLAQPATGGLNVDYAYGFAGELGGGPYGPPSNFNPPNGPTVTLHVSAILGGAGATGSPDRPFPTVEAAIAVAPGYLAASNCYILIDDSATYTPPGDAERWGLANQGPWTLRVQSAPEAAPALRGGIDIVLAADARVELSGLMILGPVTSEGPGQLAVEHCTVPPGPNPALTLSVPGTDTALVALTFCIVGPILAGPQVQLSVHDSIVDGLGAQAIGAAGQAVGSVDLQRSTVFGTTTAAILNTEDSIFTGTVTAGHPEAGLVRYSFVARGSRPPTLIQCQPPPLDGVRRPDRLVPRFTSTRYGDPGYGQLDLACPVEISAGADLGGEMGAFNWLQQPAHASRLPTVLGDMLPAGAAASITYRS